MANVRKGQIWREHKNKDRLLVILQVFPGAGVARVITCDTQGEPSVKGRMTQAKLATFTRTYKLVKSVHLAKATPRAALSDA